MTVSIREIRLDLSGMCHNRRGLALYHKMGFLIEGHRRNSQLVDGRYVAKYTLSKILE